MPGRRVMFWLGVAGTSIIANFALEVLSDRFPQSGFARFTAFTHRGVS